MGHISVGVERPYFKYYTPESFISRLQEAGYGSDHALIDDRVGHETVILMNNFSIGTSRWDDFRHALLFEIRLARILYPHVSIQTKVSYAQAKLMTTNGLDIDQRIEQVIEITRQVQEGTLTLDKILRRYRKKMITVVLECVKKYKARQKSVGQMSYSCQVNN